MTQTDNRIERIVAQFGGFSALARQVGRGSSTISDWVANGMVPSHRIEAVIKAGRRMDPPIILEPNDFFCVSLSRPRICPRGICLLDGTLTSVVTDPGGSETNESGEKP